MGDIDRAAVATKAAATAVGDKPEAVTTVARCTAERLNEQTN